MFSFLTEGFKILEYKSQKDFKINTSKDDIYYYDGEEGLVRIVFGSTPVEVKSGKASFKIPINEHLRFGNIYKTRDEKFYTIFGNSSTDLNNPLMWTIQLNSNSDWAKMEWCSFYKGHLNDVPLFDYIKAPWTNVKYLQKLEDDYFEKRHKKIMTKFGKI